MSQIVKSVARREIKINGIVQGVGFRPFIYQLATSLGLKGYVLNSSEGVIIDVEGEPHKTDEFISLIKSKSPPLSRIENIVVRSFSFAEIKGYTSFEIRESVPPSTLPLTKGGIERKVNFALISPDIATCPDCLSELLNPDDRRYQYPFINCINCGPRYSITLDIPYDRQKTTMSKFTMCSDCEREYHDPSDRRFHAQPNACKVCGPQIKLKVQSSKFKVKEKEPLKAAVELLNEGAIGAIKGLGGFHIACDATNDDAVKKLREKKRRSNKPFAIMCPDMNSVKKICELSRFGEALLNSELKPIVLLPKKSEDKASHYTNPISRYIAPDNNNFGVMLPYTPLHYLLFYQLTAFSPESPETISESGQTLRPSPISALVMTSGNLSEEPIVINNDEAIERLSDIADFFLFHDRDIYMRVDDSIVREYKGIASPLPVARPIHRMGAPRSNGSPAPPSEGGRGTHPVDGSGVVIRRSRGYVPNPIDFGIDMPEILGCGGELKNTFTLTKGHYAIMSQHIGDLENYEAIQFYKETLKNLKNSFKVEPIIIAHDLHPDYWTTKFAKETAQSPLPPFAKKGLGGISIIGVQHHHAHIASCMAENHFREKVIGVAWDGTGYGTDGAIWGGEFLIADYKGFDRACHFRYVPLPGGDKAIKEPYRMALSYLYDTFGMDFLKLNIPCIKPPAISLQSIKLILNMIDNRINTTMTSSVGRLFDAVSFLLNSIDVVTFEGEAAIKLEMMADKSVNDIYKSKKSEVRGTHPVDGSQKLEYPIIIDTRFLIQGIVNDLLVGVDSAVISAKFHNTLAEIIIEFCRKIKTETGIDRVVLSGGCFQNILLLDRTLSKLNNEFKTFIHKDVPTNDGGISLGQAVVAREIANID
ncbi:MAG: carbamoyltransferase HypF [Nitrospinota bacterium]